MAESTSKPKVVKKKSKRRKRSTTSAEPGNTAETELVQKIPTRKRASSATTRTRKKKTSKKTKADAAVVETPVAEPVETEVTPVSDTKVEAAEASEKKKPARRRRAKKTTKSATRTRKTAETDEAVAEASPAVEAPETEAAETVQRPRVEPEKVEPEKVEPEKDSIAGAVAESVVGSDAVPAGEKEEEGRREGRRRSRGRRRRRGRSSRPEADEAGVSKEPSPEDHDAEVVEVEPSAEEAVSEGLPSEDRESGERPLEGTGRRRRRSRSRSRGDNKDKDKDKEERAEEVSQAPRKIGHNERVMLINVAEGEETRIGIVHNSRLEELFMERSSSASQVGNIYKGIVTNVEPSIQAAFIDFGLPKHGFLHISDLQPQYFPDGKNQMEKVGRKTPRRERPPIQRCLRRGQEVIVQIIKQGIGLKGPTLTTYLSIPGRYVVMMPGMDRLGVSRKIEDEDARRKMRKILDELDPPPGMGYILRTAGLDKTKRDLQRDLLYLQRLWKVVVQRVKNEPTPCELYQESDLVIRTIRDVYSSDIDRIVVDNEESAKKVSDFMSIAMPRKSSPVELHEGHEPIFHKYGIEDELERLYDRYVPLPSGGSLVIDSTEAMVAIDVNSGKFRDIDDAEESALRLNVEAAEEIARQLRLRDLGGLILCDFIDMRFEKNRRTLERVLRDALKNHKERAKILRTSEFGIIEMTRQRMGPSLKRSIYKDCSHCRGAGLVKTAESMTLDVMRLMRLAAHRKHVVRIELRVASEVAYELLNRKRDSIHRLEAETESTIYIRGDGSIGADQYRFECYDQRGSVLRVIERKAEPGLKNERKRGDKGARGHQEEDEIIEVFD